MLFPSVFNNHFADDFFDDFFKAPARTAYPAVNTMRTDVKELDDAYALEMQLPGYALGNIEVEVKDGYLTVLAKHEADKEEKDEQGKYIRRECYRGSCERSFYVGEHVNKENVKASFKDGILKLTLPKQEALPKEEETRQLVQIEG